MATFDAHKNLAYSTVATAPSPASSGTSLVVQSGDGTKFPTAPFNALIWPASTQPTTANAEIVRVTAISTDTFTITRAQESSSARTVVVGDQIANVISAKTITDIENVTDQVLMTTTGDLVYASAAHTPARLAIGSTGQVLGVSGGVPAWQTGAPQRLFDSTLGSDAASIDTGANGIAGGFDVLEIWMIMRTSDSGVFNRVDVTFNNDGGANYDTEDLSGANATVTAASDIGDTSIPLRAPGTGGAANYATVVRMTIPGYAQTTFYKVGEFTMGMNDTTAANNHLLPFCFTYRSTAAITRMKIAPDSGLNLKAGSRLLIYGR